MDKNGWKMIHWGEGFIGAWIDLFEAIIGICCLGFYRPWWGVDFKVS